MSILGIYFGGLFYTGNINASSFTSNLKLSPFSTDMSLKEVAL